jgi:hypothetical protein
VAGMSRVLWKINGRTFVVGNIVSMVGKSAVKL